MGRDAGRFGTTSCGDACSPCWDTWITSGRYSSIMSTPGWFQRPTIRPSASGIGCHGPASPCSQVRSLLLNTYQLGELFPSFPPFLAPPVVSLFFGPNPVLLGYCPGTHACSLKFCTGSSSGIPWSSETSALQKWVIFFCCGPSLGPSFWRPFGAGHAGQATTIT